MSEEIGRQLKKKERVRVGILKTALANEKATQIATKTAEQIRASLVEVRGNTSMLYKPGQKVKAFI